MPFTDPNKEQVRYLLPRSLTGEIRSAARRLGVYPATVVEAACLDYLARTVPLHEPASRRAS